MQTITEKDRIDPHDLSTEYEEGAMILDIRTAEQRSREGALSGALVVDSWDLTASEFLTASGRVYWMPPLQRVVVVSSDGGESAQAAETLRRLGHPNAAHLAGGFQAWKRAVSV